MLATNGRRIATVRRPRVLAPRQLQAPARTNLPERLFLVGFMGCGKTTLGRLLADRLRWDFVDLDVRIEESAGMPIRRIFELHGEGHFRRLEHEALRAIASDRRREIVAIGGGAFVGEVNRAVIRKAGVSVWIDAPFRTIARRILGDRKRPLAETAEQINHLYRSRLPFYHEADLRVRVGDATPNRIAREVLRVLREDWSIVAERRRLFP